VAAAKAHGIESDLCRIVRGPVSISVQHFFYTQMTVRMPEGDAMNAVGS
jgi:hypothetical protein